MPWSILSEGQIGKDFCQQKSWKRKEKEKFMNELKIKAKEDEDPGIALTDETVDRGRNRIFVTWR